MTAPTSLNGNDCVVQQDRFYLKYYLEMTRGSINRVIALNA